MNLRALLVCEDVRIEVDGTLTLIGVRNDRLCVRKPRFGPIVIERLAFLVVVSGLSGLDRVGFRADLRDVLSTSSIQRPRSYEDHAPSADEHNFIFAYSPMVFARTGTYVMTVDLEAATQSATYSHRFRVETEDHE